MSVRERYEELERRILSPRAALAAESRGRVREEEPSEYRTCFQRDRDRVVHCKSFRRLKHKTQVFLAPEGDHFRTRLTHTLEVSQIARTIARALALNEDLTEAIALGHDLGHTPFGHAGERALDRVMEGGFRHYEQSVRMVEKLENDGEGLNLTDEVRNGILCHTKGTEAYTLEGRIVRMADKVAYIHHDMDDAIRAGVLKETDIPAAVRAELGENRGDRLDTLITDVINNSVDQIMLSPAKAEAFDELYKFMFSALYVNPTVKSEERKAEELVTVLFEWYREDPVRLPAEAQAIAWQEGPDRAIADHLASMTDNYVVELYQQIFIPRRWELK